MATTTRKATPAKAASTRTRSLRGNSDARDAVLRAAEDAATHGKRGSIQVESTRAQRFAKKADVERVAAELSDRFIHCRDYGHTWRMANFQTHGKGYSRTMFCPSCKFSKDQTLDRDGFIVDEKPNYPDGYLIKGLGRIGKDTKGMFRVATIVRAIEHTESKRAKAS